MKDILSFQTALALKEAGFPHPEFGPGQFWYDEDGQLYVVAETKALVSICHTAWRYRPESKDVVTFAASVTDMMRELTGMSLSFAMGVFFVYGGGFSSCRPNAAELLASAWLEKNSAEK